MKVLGSQFIGQEKLHKIDILSYPFNNFKGRGASLEKKEIVSTYD